MNPYQVLKKWANVDLVTSAISPKLPDSYRNENKTATNNRLVQIYRRYNILW